MFVRDMNFGKYEESSAGGNVELFCANVSDIDIEKKYFSKIYI